MGVGGLVGIQCGWWKLKVVSIIYRPYDTMRSVAWFLTDIIRLAMLHSMPVSQRSSDEIV